MHITRDEARMLAVIGQRLDRRPRGRVKPDRILEMIRHLGCVQLDTISVVARSHETVLYSRLGAFAPADVWSLYGDGALIEYWAHAAAIIPVEMFPYFRRAMAHRGLPEQWAGKWLIENQETADHVLATIREQGPQSSRSFERPDGPKPEAWAWYGGKPAKQALDYLWTTGALTVIQRNGFQRVYDLTERALPEDLRASLPTVEEQQRSLTLRALRAMGVATTRWIRDYFRTGGVSHMSVRETNEALNRLVDEGLVLPVSIDGIDEPGWLDVDLAPRLDALRAGKGKPTLTTLLSPFDNLVWFRERTLELFDFHYRLESYTPEPKRIYGYYTLPVLHRGRLIGRLDLHYTRKVRLLTVKAAHLEPGVKATDRIAAAIADAVIDYLHFLGGGEIVLGKTDPPALHPLLRQAFHDRA